MKNPSWSRDEHLVALNFYLLHTPRIPDKDSSDIKELSSILNNLQLSIGGEISDKFRNANGVYMKLMNFRRFDPAYKGVGLANGNKDEEIVWNLYSDKPDELKKIVSQITSFLTSNSFKEVLPSLDGEEESNEGQILTRVHRYRERDSRLIKRKKEKFKSEFGKLFCQCCGFDFLSKYGAHGEDFIECHHTKPISESGVNETTKLSDLILLCSNCHRMIHRKKPWLTFELLKAKLNE
jgi:5-methylcytosine-specific restriction protein A